MNKFFSWLLLIGLLSATQALPGQSLLDEVKSMASVMTAPEQMGMARAAPASPTSQPNLWGILAAYGHASPEAALEQSYSPEVILQTYQHNPYLRSLLSDEAQLNRLKNQFNQDSVAATILRIRQGAREKILQRLSSADVYADNRMFRSKALMVDYQLPRIENKDALRAASVDLGKLQMGADPASFAATMLSGLADWIANRAQEEFVQSFMLGLQRDLSEKQLNLLFPNTAQYLEAMNVINYRAILTNARLAFAQDLNTLSLNLSNYLFAAGNIPQNNPRSFNLLLFYRLIDLARRDLSLPEILAYANGEFSRRQFESEKLLHDNLVAHPESEAFRALQDTFRTTNAALIKTYDKLTKLGESIAASLSRIDAAGRAKFPERNQQVELLQEKLDSFNYVGLFSNQQNKLLSEVNDFLQGQLAYDILRARPSFDQYEAIFTTSAPDSKQLRGVGLTMIRELLRQEDGDYPIILAMSDYFQQLLAWENEVFTLAKLVEADRQNPSDVAKQLRQNLESAILREQTFWDTTASPHEQQALAYLSSLVQNVRADESLDANGQIAYLSEVEQRLDDHVRQLARRYPQTGVSPSLTQAAQQAQHEDIYRRLEQNARSLDNLQATLDDLESAGPNLAFLDSYRSASVFSNVLQAGTQLLYCLAANGPNPQELSWANPSQLTDVLNNDTQRQLFLGLLYQRISTLTGRFSIDSRGLAQVATQVASQFTAIDTTNRKTSPLLGKIEFATGILNSILETPLLRTDPSGNTLISLSERYQKQGMAKVPAINRQLNELFRHTETQDYRFALNNVLQLINLFEVYPRANRRLEKLNNRLDTKEKTKQTVQTQLKQRNLAGEQRTKLNQRLADLNQETTDLERRLIHFDTVRQRRYRNLVFRYGQFMADLTAADSPSAVQSAFSAVALPKGSSQNKRLKPFSAELNAYFGGALGYEKILNEADIDAKTKVNSFGLFVPVGFALSKRLGAKSNASLSLFLPVIDLGALTAYRTDATDQQLDILPEFSFANVLSPGAHLLYNFPKSPFFIGSGLQYGPNVREYKVGEDIEQVRALRFMFTFGMDVPILSFNNN